jgi:PAS domain S-box-containing protein
MAVAKLAWDQGPPADAGPLARPVNRSSGQGLSRLIRIQGQRPASTDIEGQAIALEIEEAPIAMAIFDRQMRYLSVSGRFKSDYGVEGQDLIGRLHYDVFPEVPERWKDAHRRALAGESLSEPEDLLVRPDGTEQWISWDVRPWRDERGDVGGVVLFAEDITGRKQAELTLAQAGRLEAVGRLAGGVAHDFNNLLAVIDGNLHLARPRIDDPKAATYIERALKAAQGAASFTRRLLSLVKHRPLTPHNLQPNAQLKEILALLQSAVGPGVTIDLALAQDAWDVECDAAELDSALVNLAMNARDAMNGAGTLLIATTNAAVTAREVDDWPSAQAGEFVRIAVTDTGSGMSAETLRRARDPFYTTKGGGRGTGLGLTSTADFLRESGGFLTLDSELGRGTTASVYLPRSAAGHAPDLAASEGLPRGEGQLVLLVDDEDAVRETLREQLEALGYAVLEARSGPEAVAQLADGKPIEIVLSDVVMGGGMSGYAVAATVQTTHPDIKVILISGATLGLEDEAPGGPPLLAKPCAEEALALALHEALVSPARSPA